MLDRKKLLSHITDLDEKVALSRLCDLAEKASHSGRVTYTDFLNPKMQAYALDIAGFSGDITAEFFGGYTGAERNVCSFSSFGDADNYQVSAVSIRTKNNKVYSHRDYLGSIMNLGIKREKLGDIVISDDRAIVLCKEDIADFIVYNLLKVASSNVICEKVELTYLKSFEREMSSFNVSVSSLRLDAVVGAMCRKSRGESNKLIDSGRVCVNYDTVLNHSYTVKNDDVISVRGYGKSVINTDGSLTKKGRVYITVNHYV